MASSTTVQEPDASWTTSTTTHIWKLRKLEREITLRLYSPSRGTSDHSPETPFEQWLPQTLEKLNQWYQTTRESVSYAGQVEFYELLYHVQLLRLNRPSPRCAHPTSEMQKAALVSCVAILREFDIIHRLGKLFYIWHAAHVIVESGICLMSLVLAGMGLETTYLKHSDVGIITKRIESIPVLLTHISRRWSSITHHAAVFDELGPAVLQELDSWSNGDPCSNDDYDALKLKLEKLSMFSPFPQEQALLALENQRNATFTPLESLPVTNNIFEASPMPFQSFDLSLPSDFGDSDNVMPCDRLDVDSTQLLESLFRNETSNT